MAGRGWDWSTDSSLQRLSQYINSHSPKPTRPDGPESILSNSAKRTKATVTSSTLFRPLEPALLD